jgi:molybdopterin-binding protein
MNSPSTSNANRTVRTPRSQRQFRGTVKAIRPASVSDDVVLDVGDGIEIVASITNEAVEDLRLEPGRPAVALIKASSIMLSPDEAGPHQCAQPIDGRGVRGHCRPGQHRSENPAGRWTGADGSRYQ